VALFKLKTLLKINDSLTSSSDFSLPSYYTVVMEWWTHGENFPGWTKTFRHTGRYGHICLLTYFTLSCFHFLWLSLLPLPVA